MFFHPCRKSGLLLCGRNWKKIPKRCMFTKCHQLTNFNNFTKSRIDLTNQLLDL